MAAIRSALGKQLGKNIKSVFCNKRSITQPVFSFTAATQQHLLSASSTTHTQHVFSAPVGYYSTNVYYTNKKPHRGDSRTLRPNCRQEARIYREYFTDMSRRLEAGDFAVEEFNKKKNAQLQLVGVLSACRRAYDRRWMDFLLLKALDGGTVNVYIAHVFPNFTGGRFLEYFGLVREKGNPLKLFDVLDIFVCKQRDPFF